MLKAVLDAGHWAGFNTANGLRFLVLDPAAEPKKTEPTPNCCLYFGLIATATP